MQIYLFLSFSAHNTIFFRTMLPKKSLPKRIFLHFGRQNNGEVPGAGLEPAQPVMAKGF